MCMVWLVWLWFDATHSTIAPISHLVSTPLRKLPELPDANTSPRKSRRIDRQFGPRGHRRGSSELTDRAVPCPRPNTAARTTTGPSAAQRTIAYANASHRVPAGPVTASAIRRATGRGRVAGPFSPHAVRSGFPGSFVSAHTKTREPVPPVVPPGANARVEPECPPGETGRRSRIVCCKTRPADPTATPAGLSHGRTAKRLRRTPLRPGASVSATIFDQVWAIAQDQFVAAWDAATTLDEAAASIRVLAAGPTPRWAVMARASALRKEGVPLKRLPTGQRPAA